MQEIPGRPASGLLLSPQTEHPAFTYLCIKLSNKTLWAEWVLQPRESFTTIVDEPYGPFLLDSPNLLTRSRSLNT